MAAIEEQQTCAYFCPKCRKCFECLQFWIQCDACKRWFHGICVNVEEYEALDIDRFHCSDCEPQFGPSVNKVITNKHRQDKTEPDADCKQMQSGSPSFIEFLLEQSKKMHSGQEVVRCVRGQQLTLAALFRNGFNIPLLVENKEGLDLIVPSESFNETVLLEKLGPDYELDVIDTRRQLSIKMRLERFVEYMKQETHQRSNIYNCISLELSKTCLSNEVKAPNVVNKLCWVNSCWPRDEDLDMKPAVSKYCLTSMQGSYTDFHIDFGGTSVWYHVLKGEKLFFLINPTEENLNLYENWMKDKNQSEIFFANTVDKCYSYWLRKGQTLFIPTGWIHAVYTPCDSIVFGGNFLHSLNISLQLSIYELEKRLKTADKYRFPHFERTHWYAAQHVFRLFRDNYAEKVPPKHLVTGVESLINALKIWSKHKESDGLFDYILMTPPPSIPNCEKLIRNLSKQWRKADRLLNGKHVTHKRKQHKDFSQLETFLPTTTFSVPYGQSVVAKPCDSSMITQHTQILEKKLTIDEKCVKQETKNDEKRLTYLFDKKESNKEVMRKALPQEMSSQNSELIANPQKKRKVQKCTQQQRLLLKMNKLTKTSKKL